MFEQYVQDTLVLFATIFIVFQSLQTLFLLALVVNKFGGR